MIIYVAKLNKEIVYVGQTVQTFSKRIGAHKSRSRNGLSLPLYKAIRKYGESIKFEVLEGSVYSQEELDFLEKYYISSYQPRYNIQEGGKKGFEPWNKGKKEIRQVVKNNISKSAKARIRTPRGPYSADYKAKISEGCLHKKQRPFRCLNNDKIYFNKITCSKDLNIPVSGISLVLMPNTRNKSYYGYKFEYLSAE